MPCGEWVLPRVSIFRLCVCAVVVAHPGERWTRAARRSAVVSPGTGRCRRMDWPVMGGTGSEARRGMPRCCGTGSAQPVKVWGNVGALVLIRSVGWPRAAPLRGRCMVGDPRPGHGDNNPPRSLVHSRGTAQTTQTWRIGIQAVTIVAHPSWVTNNSTARDGPWLPLRRGARGHTHTDGRRPAWRHEEVHEGLVAPRHAPAPNALQLLSLPAGRQSSIPLLASGPTCGGRWTTAACP
jgi:hypothetical protein